MHVLVLPTQYCTSDLWYFRRSRAAAPLDGVNGGALLPAVGEGAAAIGRVCRHRATGAGTARAQRAFISSGT